MAIDQHKMARTVELGCRYLDMCAANRNGQDTDPDIQKVSREWEALYASMTEEERKVYKLGAAS